MRKVLVIEYLNNEFKQKYIKEKSTISENFTRNIFNKADDLEKFYNKDICNFTLSEIKNLLLTLNSTSVEYNQPILNLKPLSSIATLQSLQMNPFTVHKIVNPNNLVISLVMNSVIGIY